MERCVFEGDKRGYLATITRQGRAFLTKATNVHLQGLRQHFLDYLSRSDLRQLANGLEAVLNAEGAPLPPLGA